MADPAWQSTLLTALPAQVQLDLTSYFVTHGIPLGAVTRADLALALLRIGTEEARSCIERVTGRAIQVGPYNPPPWPPRPVARSPEHLGPRLVRVDPNPCLPTTQAFLRYKKLRVGLTEAQLKTRGISRRDVQRWTAAGRIQFEEV
ncbi:MAG: hypothetical protein EHM78_02315 [Myxococcaceae bacterium]|nr:MAG: hypothetical protein EHM78_02315 [Myxococcaceae bacterium]